MMQQKKVQYMLNIFQEGVIESMKHTGTDLNFKLECVFLADKIDKSFTSFYGVFKQCEDIYFKPWEDEYSIITDLREIVSLKIDLLNTELEEDGYFKIYTNCANTYNGGNLYIKALDLKVYDEDLTEIAPDFLNDLAEKYWYSTDNSQG